MLLKSLKLTNLLSFGPDSEAFELRPLNVLIGPNGSGKSNFIEAIGLLKAAPNEIVIPIREGGGVEEWIWKGGERSPKGARAATIEAVSETFPGEASIRHRMTFESARSRFAMIDERVEDEEADGFVDEKPHVYFSYEQDLATLHGKDGSPPRTLERATLHSARSILNQVRGPGAWAQMSDLSDAYESIALYREWSFGRRGALRIPQPADLPTDHLLENGTNLGLILNKFGQAPTSKAALVKAMQQVFYGIVDFWTRIEGGTVQVHLVEEGGWTTPATRLSDGTLRWLSLLAVLLDPNPPGLVCIEEPEMGLHPDLMPTLADLLRSASERMQLVVTTHSDTLVDALNDSPEDIVVCEREEGSTVMRRLDAQELAEWMKTYRLGQLWSKGVLGGNRW